MHFIGHYASVLRRPGSGPGSGGWWWASPLSLNYFPSWFNNCNIVALTPGVPTKVNVCGGWCVGCVPVCMLIMWRKRQTKQRKHGTGLFLGLYVDEGVL